MIIETLDGTVCSISTCIRGQGYGTAINSAGLGQAVPNVALH